MSPTRQGLVIVGFLAVGCSEPDRGPPPSMAMPTPWTDLAPIPLDPFRRVLLRHVAAIEAPRRATMLRALPLTFVETGDGAAVYVLDQRYANIATSQCVPNVLWPALDDEPWRQGSCEDGSIETGRGVFAPEAGVAAVAVDDTRLQVFVVDGAGELWAANANVMLGNPLDWLRFTPVAKLPAGGTTLAVDPSGELRYGTGSTLVHVSADGTVGSEETFAAPIVDLVADAERTWVITAAGVAADDASVELPGVMRAVPDGVGGLFATVPGGLVHLTWNEGALVVAESAIEGLTGPLALDPSTGRIALALQAGVGLRETDGTIAVVAEHTPADIALGPGHEIVLIQSGAVAVHVDERALAEPSRPPLQVWMAVMAETPKSDPDEVDCADLWDSYVSASNDMALFATMPIPKALAFTPALAREIDVCGATSLFARTWADDATEVGVLVHDDPSQCDGDARCYTDFVGGEVDAVRDIGADVRWVGGLDAHWDDGYDWVNAVRDSGASDRVMFFGLGASPDIPQDDPRSKEPFPFEGAAPTTRLFVDSAADLSPSDDGLLLLPGNTVSAYTLGGCANLFISECKLVDLGGKSTYTPDDVMVLDLLLERAIAVRSDTGPDTWYLHMPDIAITDYTEGCTMDAAGTWGPSGDAVCEGALVQAWVESVYQRFVLNGVAAWAFPSDVR